MLKQQHHVASSQNDRLLWLIRFCRWLWKLAGFLGTAVVVALAVNVTSTKLTTSKGMLPQDAPFSLLMTNWPISLLIGCCLFLLALIFWAISRWSLPSSTITAAITPQNRKRMLKRLRVRYKQSLAQSLQGAVPIELGLASRPTAIHNALSLSLHLPEQPEQMLSPHTSIIDAYEQAQQELLILGEPGAGKSTLLLELAQHLVAQAEQYAVQPLPVLLPLSSWAMKRLSLQEWLIEQFASLYDVSPQISQDWLQADLVLPLLDGLDEMEASARPSCIAAINTYHREHLHPLVICSRTNEYDAATLYERLALHTAIVVQPLTLEQINAHLTILTMSGKPFAALRTALQKNSTLAQLATTPLMLRMLILTYHWTEVWQLPHKQVVLQQQIWKDYVQQMISRKGDSKRYPLEQTCAWLGWLAQQMRKHNQTIFFLEQFQSDWFPRRQRAMYEWSIYLIHGLLAMLFGGLVLGLASGLVLGLVGGLFFGLLYSLTFGLLYSQMVGLESKIKPVEALIWSWKDLKELLDGEELSGGLLGGLFFGTLFGILFRQRFGLLIGLFFLLVVGLFGGLLGGLSEKQLTQRHILSPNEGIRRSIKNGLFLGLLGGVPSGLFFLLFAGLGKHSGGLVGRLPLGLSLGLVGGLFAGLVFGLDAALQHYILRFWLWRSHLFPLKAVSFLEDATARILLQRVGGGYSFTHRLLLDYFADLEITPPTPLPVVPPTPSPPLP